MFQNDNMECSDLE